MQFIKALKIIATKLLLAASASTIATDAVGEANKKIVVDFSVTAAMKLDFESAVNLLGPKYIPQTAFQ